MSEAGIKGADSGGNGRDLTPKQRATIPHLVAAPTREEGCRRGGIGRSTLTRWIAEAPFREALRAAEDAAYREALKCLQGLTGAAVDTLRDLLASDADAVRLRAAVEILAHGLKARDSIEIEERLAALEAEAHEAARSRGRFGA